MVKHFSKIKAFDESTTVSNQQAFKPAYPRTIPDDCQEVRFPAHFIESMTMRYKPATGKAIFVIKNSSIQVDYRRDETGSVVLSGSRHALQTLEEARVEHFKRSIGSI